MSRYVNCWGSQHFYTKIITTLNFPIAPVCQYSSHNASVSLYKLTSNAWLELVTKALTSCFCIPTCRVPVNHDFIFACFVKVLDRPKYWTWTLLHLLLPRFSPCYKPSSHQRIPTKCPQARFTNPINGKP